MIYLRGGPADFGRREEELPHVPHHHPDPGSRARGLKAALGRRSQEAWRRAQCLSRRMVESRRLEALLGLSGPLSRTLDVRTRERIAIAVAEENSCDYCLSAHTYLGLNLAKITPEDAALARKGSSTDAKAAAAVRFAVQVAKTRGGVSDADIAAVKDAGYSEAQIVEIVALVVENVFTNFLNRVAQTDIDFPVLHTSEAA
jgi:AhpD family alkylhydroperoxidase